MADQGAKGTEERTASSRPRRTSLLLGDTLMFLIFAVVGRTFHTMQNSAMGVLGVAFPFLAGWLLAGAITHAYGARATSSPARAARNALVTWVLAVPLGLAIRALILGRPSQSAFVTVVVIYTLVALVGWRVLYSLIASRTGAQ